MTDDDKALNARVELLLTGDDGGCFAANGTKRNDRISKAIIGAPKDFIELLRSVNAPAYGNYMCYWTMREGQPWQADIERHVSEYRADPRPFTTDLDLCRRELIPAIIERVAERCGHREFSVSVTFCANGKYGFYGALYDEGRCIVDLSKKVILPSYYEEYDTPERAIVAAFLAVCERE